MRHWIAVASVAAALTLLISTPVLARTTMHGGSHAVGHHHRAMVGNRFVFISRTGFDSHFLFFDRFSRRFIAVPRHRFAGFGRFAPFSRFNPFNGFAGFDGFGSWGWDWGSGGWADYGGTLASAEPPAAEFGALPPPAPRSPAELPRCHDTTSVGIVIERSNGCVH
jgi:hypothetical protein